MLVKTKNICSGKGTKVRNSCHKTYRNLTIGFSPTKIPQCREKYGIKLCIFERIDWNEREKRKYVMPQVPTRVEIFHKKYVRNALTSAERKYFSADKSYIFIRLLS